jgi:predicted membrane protein
MWDHAYQMIAVVMPFGTTLLLLFLLNLYEQELIGLLLVGSVTFFFFKSFGFLSQVMQTKFFLIFIGEFLLLCVTCAWQVRHIYFSLFWTPPPENFGQLSEEEIDQLLRLREELVRLQAESEGHRAAEYGGYKDPHFSFFGNAMSQWSLQRRINKLEKRR